MAQRGNSLGLITLLEGMTNLSLDTGMTQANTASLIKAAGKENQKTIRNRNRRNKKKEKATLAAQTVQSCLATIAPHKAKGPEKKQKEKVPKKVIPVTELPTETTVTLTHSTDVIPKLPKKKEQKPQNYKASRIIRRSIDTTGRANVNGCGKSTSVSDCLKIYAIFQCNSEACKKQWKSAHGWTTYSPELYCGLCESRAKVVKMEEKEGWVENFHCSNETCGNEWPTTSDPDNPYLTEECDICSSIMTSGGAQKRFGRYYLIQCLNKECGNEGEEPCFEKEYYTQKCMRCNTSGSLVGKRRETKEEQQTRRTRSSYGGGGHNADCCDMCQKLRSQGVSRTCTRKQRVIIKKDIQKDGSILEKIIYTENLEAKESHGNEKLGKI